MYAAQTCGRRDARVERCGGARGRLRHSGRRGRRQRHLRGPSGGKPRRGAGALGRRPDADRVQDLPLARPHRAPRAGRSPRPGRRSRRGSGRIRSRCSSGSCGSRATSTTPGCEAMEGDIMGRSRGRRRLRRGKPVPTARAGDRRRVCGLMRGPDDARADIQRGRSRGHRRGDAARSEDLLHVDRRASAAAQRVRRPADQGDADRRSGADRHGDRRGRLRLPPDRRLAAGDVLLCRDGPDRQSGREDPLHVRRPGELPDPVSGVRRRRRPGRGAALAVALFDVHECRRPEDVSAVDALRHEGAVEDGDPRQQPGHLVRSRAG